MKKKNIALSATIVGVTALALGATAIKLNNNNKLAVYADDNYTLSFGVLNESTKTGMSGTYNGKTAIGNDFQVEWDGIYNYGDDVNYAPTGATFEITKALGSITALDFSYIHIGGWFKIYCGWYNEATSSVKYWKTLETSTGSPGGEFHYDLSDIQANYIKVESTNGFGFKETTVSYKCVQSECPYVKYGDLYLIANETGYTVDSYVGSTGGVVTIPAEVNGKPVNKIGEGAFRGISLNSVTIPYSVTEIGAFAFYQCYLKSVTLNEGLIKIGDYAFQYNSFTTLSIPDSVTTINQGAFFCNSNLADITIQSTSNLDFVGNAAFRDLAISTIYIPASVTRWFDDFYKCPNLTAITVDPNNVNYISIDGIMYNKEITTLFKYPEGKTNTSYSTPSTLTEISSYSLCNESLTSVTFNAGLKYFYGYCTLPNVENYNFNEFKIHAIDSDNFSHNTKITSYDFEFCTISSIYGGALSDNSELETIVLPEGLTYLATSAITDNPKLSSLIYSGTVKSWSDYGFKTTFEGCPLLTTITCEDGLISL